MSHLDKPYATPSPASAPSLTVRGRAASPSVGLGRLHFLKNSSSVSTAPYRGRECELASLREAIELARSELSALAERTRQMLDEGAAAIFETHALLLDEPDFVLLAEAGVERGLCAVEAVRAAACEISHHFDALDDEYLRARGADVRDIGERLVSILSKTSPGSTDASVPSSQPSPSRPFSADGEILVAEELSPAETVGLDSGRTLGIVTFGGSVSSHASILARALSIPAIVAAERFGTEYEGAVAIIDGEGGYLVLNPTEEELLRYAARRRELDEEKASFESSSSSTLPAITRDGHRIGLYANIGSVEDAIAAHEVGAEGIGLFRTELLFLRSPSLPTEEEQFLVYRRVAEIMHDRPGGVVIRTLDIGADKALPGVSQKDEPNPALGVRGIRLCLHKPDIFKTQLRAILRASLYGKLSLMLPMVTNVDEVRTARRIICEVKASLIREGVAIADDIRVGIMIETPASALMADALALECDFFSVGTNDLCQYTYAADRENPSLSSLYEGCAALEPIMRLIELASRGIHSRGDGFLGICGELASSLSLTRRFIELGADELSLSPPYIARMRSHVREL